MWSHFPKNAILPSPLIQSGRMLSFNTSMLCYAIHICFLDTENLPFFEFFLFLRWVLPVLSWSGTRWFPKNFFWSLLDMSCSGSCHFNSCHKICFAKKVAQVSVRTERTWLLEQCVVSWFQPLCSDMTAGQVEKTGYPYPHFENKL